MKLALRLSFRLAFCLALLLAFGCAADRPGAPGTGGAKPSSPPPPRVIVTPANAASTLGLVISVDAPGRFVVLSFPPGRLPAVDRRYTLYRRGLKVGELRISGPRTGDNTVADLLRGNAEAGDEARPD